MKQIKRKYYTIIQKKTNIKQKEKKNIYKQNNLLIK